MSVRDLLAISIYALVVVALLVGLAKTLYCTHKIFKTPQDEVSRDIDREFRR